MTPGRSRIGYRWTICALVFFAVTVNYLDRQLFSVLVPFFEDDLKLGPTDLALINVSFILPYGFAMLFVGQFVDRIGTRKGLGLAFILWSLASALHSSVRSLLGFIGIRFVLGIGESAMYPSAVKAMTDWFPKKERATGIGIFNAGSNVGAILAPLLGVWIATNPHLGWRACFLITGCSGLVWLFFWYPTYRQPEDHPKVSAEELAEIQADKPEKAASLSITQLFTMRSVYGLAIAKALSDAPFWFYLTWMPKLLVDQFHVSAQFMALSIPVIYIVADLGSIAGGWMSSTLLKRGVELNRARKLPMLTCAFLILPVACVGSLVEKPDFLGISPVIAAVALVALAAGAHQGWSSNLFATISDSVPQGSMAMAVGAINGFAMVGVSVMQLFVGRAVQLTSSYALPFVACGVLYLIAYGVLQVFIPHIGPEQPKGSAKPQVLVFGGALLLGGLCFLQYLVNKPPFVSMSDYLARRGNEIHSNLPPMEGASASVGWMGAHWYRWTLSSGKTKWELVKMDTYGHPFVESKGIKASKYKGPTLDQLDHDPGILIAPQGTK